MFGRYRMERNGGRRCNRIGAGYGFNGFRHNNRLELGYSCRDGFRRNSLDSIMCIGEKELLEEQKVLLERKLETINTQLESYKGE